MPWAAAGYLDVADVPVVKRCAGRRPTQHDHAREIQQVYGYRCLPDVGAAAGLADSAAAADPGSSLGCRILLLVARAAGLGI